MSNINDVIDTENWVMKVGRNAQHDEFASSVIGSGDPNNFWIHEFPEQSRDVYLSDLSTVTIFSQWMTIVPAGTNEEHFDTVDSATVSGFPMQQIFWFYKAN